jgi:cytoskeletal protein RodZ
MDPESPRSIGGALREARERQRLTLAECVERTRIRRKYLEALENEDFHQLPEAAYTRGFLRTYASALGVDSDRLVDAYDEVAEAPSHDLGPMELRARDAPRLEGRREGHDGKRSHRTPLRALIWALIGVAVVVAVAFLASRGIAMEADAIGGSAGYFSR